MSYIPKPNNFKGKNLWWKMHVWKSLKKLESSKQISSLQWEPKRPLRKSRSKFRRGESGKRSTGRSNWSGERSKERLLWKKPKLRENEERNCRSRVRKQRWDLMIAIRMDSVLSRFSDLFTILSRKGACQRFRKRPCLADKSSIEILTVMATMMWQACPHPMNFRDGSTIQLTFQDQITTMELIMTHMDQIHRCTVVLMATSEQMTSTPKSNQRSSLWSPKPRNLPRRKLHPLKWSRATTLLLKKSKSLSKWRASQPRVLILKALSFRALLLRSSIESRNLNPCLSQRLLQVQLKLLSLPLKKRFQLQQIQLTNLTLKLFKTRQRKFSHWQLKRWRPRSKNWLIKQLRNRFPNNLSNLKSKTRFKRNQRSRSISWISIWEPLRIKSKR